MSMTFGILQEQLSENIWRILKNNFTHFVKSDYQIGIGSSLKFYSAIILSRKFDIKDAGLYNYIFLALVKTWSNYMTDAEKESFVTLNSQNHIQMYLKYTEIFHPEYYFHNLLKQPFSQKILDIAKAKLPVKYGKESQINREIDNLLRWNLKLKISKEVFVYDGLLECDFMVIKNDKTVIIEYFGPTHYLGNTNKFTGTTQLILDLKRKLHPVIVIPYYEWRDLSQTEKAEYLTKKIDKLTT